jgi:hypothetical protein
VLIPTLDEETGKDKLKRKNEKHSVSKPNVNSLSRKEFSPSPLVIRRV